MKKIILTSILIYSIVLFFRVFANESIDHDSNYSHDLIEIKFGNYGEINNNSRMSIGKIRDYKEKGDSCYLDKYDQEINVSGTYYLKAIDGVIYIC